MPVGEPQRRSGQTTRASSRGAAPVSSERARRRWWSPILRSIRSDAALAVFGAVVGAVAVWIAHRGLIDDAYITLSYGRNLAPHGHWGLVAGETANTATSPLNVLLLAASMRVVSLFTGAVRPVLALGVLTVAIGALLGWWLARCAACLGISRAWASAGVVVVLANPFLLSALGLEVVLLSSLMAGLLAASLRERPVAFAVLGGLALLARLDMIVFVVPMALLTPPVRQRAGRTAAIAAAVGLPWFVWSWWELGSAIPDTFVIKTLQHSFGESAYFSGLWTYYRPINAAAVWVSVAPALVGLIVAASLVLRRLRSPAARDHGPLLGLAVGGLAYYGAYSALGVSPHQWYYVPPQAALAIVAALGAGVLLRGAAVGALPWAVGVGVTVLAPLGLLATLEGRSLPWPYPPIFGNYATPSDYQAAGHELTPVVSDDRVAAPFEIGTVAFACECQMIDLFSDRAVVIPLIEQRTERASVVMRWLLRVNYARLETSKEPEPVRHRLVWFALSDPAGDTPGPSWPTNSPRVGPGRLVLLPA
jgi:hypothetical protein